MAKKPIIFLYEYHEDPVPTWITLNMAKDFYRLGIKSFAIENDNSFDPVKNIQISLDIENMKLDTVARISEKNKLNYMKNVIYAEGSRWGVKKPITNNAQRLQGFEETYVRGCRLNKFIYETMKRIIVIFNMFGIKSVNVDLNIWVRTELEKLPISEAAKVDYRDAEMFKRIKDMADKTKAGVVMLVGASHHSIARRFADLDGYIVKEYFFKKYKQCTAELQGTITELENLYKNNQIDGLLLEDEEEQEYVKKIRKDLRSVPISIGGIFRKIFSYLIMLKVAYYNFCILEPSEYEQNMGKNEFL